jgi:hypothetical protein
VDQVDHLGLEAEEPVELAMDHLEVVVKQILEEAVVVVMVNKTHHQHLVDQVVLEKLL